MRILIFILLIILVITIFLFLKYKLASRLFAMWIAENKFPTPSDDDVRRMVKKIISRWLRR